VKYIALFILLVFTCCAPLEVEHKGTVSLEVKVNLEQVLTYFEVKCTQDNPTATPEEINTCVSDRLDDFVTTLGLRA